MSFFSNKLREFFSRSKISDDFFDDLTDALIEGDFGAKNAFSISEELKKICIQKKISEELQVKNEFFKILLQKVQSYSLTPLAKNVNIIMILGVNGVGKTTTAAKIAKFFKDSGQNVILAAADTFRAASEEQLSLHAQKIGVRIVQHAHGSDPSSVVFDAADAMRAAGGGIVIADTAGRLHNRENLVRELQKIDRICEQKADPECAKKILVLDSTTGQNAIRQAEVFSEAVKIDAAVFTKCDSSAKGGTIFSLGIPVAFVCTGESLSDFAFFSPENYTKTFLDLN